MSKSKMKRTDEGHSISTTQLIKIEVSARSFSVGGLGATARCRCLLKDMCGIIESSQKAVYQAVNTTL